MEFVSTENAPGAIGPYSQGVIEGGFLYTSGQVGLIPGVVDGVTTSAGVAIREARTISVRVKCAELSAVSRLTSLNRLPFKR